MQSNVIFGFIFVAWLFFITARGELPVYLTILRGGGKQQNNSSSATGGSGNGGSSNAFPLGSLFDGASGDTGSDITNPLDPGSNALDVGGETNALDPIGGF